MGYGFLEYETLQSCQDAISSMNQFDLGGQFLRVGRAITPPDCRNTGSQPPSQTAALPSASALAAAAVTARIQAMDAVATNFNVDSKDIKKAQEKEEARERERESRQRDRDKADRLSRESKPSQSSKPSDENPNVKKEENKPDPPASLPASSSDSQPPPPAPASLSGGPPAPPGDKQAQTLQAIEQAQQLELHKKLAESGSETVTLSQQENMQIKGQSARHLVMQKLIGARGGMRESKVLCLKNMVGSEEVDEQLQEEIEEECSKYGDVENVIIYQERQSEEEDAEIIVKIFVEFGHPGHAKKCRDSLHGRFFGGRQVGAHIYDQMLFDERDFSH